MVNKPLPGTHLHRLVKKWTGQDVKLTCKCMQWIRKMDREGPDWCRKHIAEIAEHMRREAKKRGWLKFIAGAFPPGTKFLIRQMILLAIENSEKEAAQHEPTGTA